jgi:putative hydrolase of the HAD superfamily
MIRAVILDFYGTLAETPDWGPSWEELVADLGHVLPREVRDRWWHDSFDGSEHDEHSQSREHYVAWQQARLTGMLADCGVPTSKHEMFLARVREIGGHRRIVAYDEVHTVLADLRARGITLAICSNWDWDLAEAVEGAGLDETVDVMVSSAWVGARKPHPRIYRHMLDVLATDPDETVFIGDTWACDVAGPREVGMRAVYLRRPHFGADSTAPADAHEYTDVHRAGDLTDLMAVAELRLTR